jgi:hypothetical protein
VVAEALVDLAARLTLRLAGVAHQARDDRDQGALLAAAQLARMVGAGAAFDLASGM